MKSSIPILFILIIALALTACEKREADPTPQKQALKMIAVADTFQVVSDSVNLNILANDINPSKAAYFSILYYNYNADATATVTINSDSTLTYKRKAGFVGWDYIDYELRVDNDGTGNTLSSQARIAIKVGTDEQFATKAALYNPLYWDMMIFAVDDDRDMHGSTWLARLALGGGTANIEIPKVGDPSKNWVWWPIKTKIYADGTFRLIPSDESDDTKFGLVDHFTAKSLDTLGNMVDVNGCTLYHEGKKYDYIYNFHSLQYLKDAIERSKLP
jgi:hypothetical protein